MQRFPSILLVDVTPEEFARRLRELNDLAKAEAEEWGAILWYASLDDDEFQRWTNLWTYLERLTANAEPEERAVFMEWREDPSSHDMQFGRMGTDFVLVFDDRLVLHVPVAAVEGYAPGSPGNN